MTTPRRTCSILLATMCSIVSGCGGVTLGPTVKREFIIVRAGRPVQILSAVTVTGRRLDDDSVARVPIGGWIAMPQEHWDVIRAELERDAEGGGG